MLHAPIKTRSCRRSTNRFGRRRGFSLVEMVAATGLMAGTLAPALTVMRDAMAVSREASRRNLLANYAVKGLECYTAITMQTWTTGTATMNGAVDGHPNIQTIITRSDSPTDGGIVGRLMHVQATAYDDADADAVLDADELRVSMRTKTSRLTSYENVSN